MDLGLAGAAVCIQGGTKGLPAERGLDPTRIGSLIAFIGSRANSCITGATNTSNTHLEGRLG